MKVLGIWILLVALTAAIARAAETNAPAFANVASNVASSSTTSNALPSSITIDGTTYSNVIWRAVTPSGVSIMHATGAATIPLAKSPPEVQKRFGYDPVRAAEAQADAKRKQKEFEDSQKAKGLILYSGRWMTPEDAQTVYQHALAAQQAAEKCSRAERDGGRITQIVSDGLIIMRRTWRNLTPPHSEGWTMVDSGEFFLVGHPNQNSFVDDTYVSCKCFSDGNYTFTTVLGATRTLERRVYCSGEE
jgi:hypothetical protein